MDELFETLTLVQTHKIDPFPIILMDRKYWSGLMDWIKGTLLADRKYIEKTDMNIFHVVDKPEEAVKIITDYYRYKKLY